MGQKRRWHRYARADRQTDGVPHIDGDLQSEHLGIVECNSGMQVFGYRMDSIGYRSTGVLANHRRDDLVFGGEGRAGEPRFGHRWRYFKLLEQSGAGDGNRTRVLSLEPGARHKIPVQRHFRMEVR